MCASDTRVGFHASYYLAGSTIGVDEGIFDDASRFSEAVRDDTNGGIGGYLCKPGSITDCKRIPNAKRYFSFDYKTPWNKYKDACFTTGDKQLYVALWGILAINGKAKDLPHGHWNVVDNDGCEDRCNRLWPNDNTTMPLCVRTDLDGQSATYMEYVYAGSGDVKSVDRCWDYGVGNWNWNDLRERTT